MKLRYGYCEGVWILWPVIIYYYKLGIELRWLGWYFGIDKRQENDSIPKAD